MSGSISERRLSADVRQARDVQPETKSRSSERLTERIKREVEGKKAEKGIAEPRREQSARKPFFDVLTCGLAEHECQSCHRHSTRARGFSASLVGAIKVTAIARVTYQDVHEFQVCAYLFVLITFFFFISFFL